MEMEIQEVQVIKAQELMRCGLNSFGKKKIGKILENIELL